MLAVAPSGGPVSTSHLAAIPAVSINLVRLRFVAVAAKIETAVGTDAIAGMPVAADWVAGDCQVTFHPSVSQNPELTGSLDRSSGIVGGLRPNLRLRLPLRGSSAGGVAPDGGRSRVSAKIQPANLRRAGHRRVGTRQDCR
jgi:hypothetical protein